MPATSAIYDRVVSQTQGDAEWLAVRCGCVSSSRIAAVTAKRQRGTGELAARTDYRQDLVIERLTGNSTDSYVSPAMEWGVETEPLARAAYEIKTSATVERVGFVLHPTIKWAGASPDGLVADDGLVEIKCPNSSTHLSYIMGRVVPEEYRPQIMWQMAVCEREWCDFVSYDPRLPENLQLFVCRMQRDDAAIAEMEKEVIKFIGEVEQTLEQLQAVQS